MAGTFTHRITHKIGETTLTADITVEHGDEWDGYDFSDWDQPDYPDYSTWPLVGTIVLDVTGPDTLHVEYWKRQGNSPQPWRSGDLNEANTPISFPVGRANNPRTFADLDRTAVWIV